MTTSLPLPSLYIPHGGGPLLLHRIGYPTPNPWDPLARWLRELPASLPATPGAVLVISGHWEEDPIALNAQSHPGLLYDYYGFPEHTYRLTYPAPGSPSLVTQVRELLKGAGFKTREEHARGLDHGVFVPFKLIYPGADVPIVQLSLQSGLDPQAHLEIGMALAPLREQGVLIIGSGMSFHNLGIRSIENIPIPQSESSTPGSRMRFVRAIRVRAMPNSSAGRARPQRASRTPARSICCPSWSPRERPASRSASAPSAAGCSAGRYPGFASATRGQPHM